MKLTRRTLLGSASAGIAATAGCLGILSGTSEFTADQVAVDSQVASETNYVKQEPKEQTIEKTFSAAGQEKTVKVVNWITQYYKTLDLPIASDQKAGVFALISSPKVEVLGQSFNPLKDWDTRKLAAQLQSQYEGFSVGQEVDQFAVQILGSAKTVSKFEGTATLGGSDVDVYILLSGAVGHESDFVVPMAVYPRQIDEQANVRKLMRNLVHPA
ncbi:DUF6517 family protein [Haloarchaeobius amylolyticus]|uniref:DUF6517 family protein n=1 Tax=Haloarchaeobius amylolyticus TaxID=1198296 RepID=UPI002271957C|nr:DUF6517 family protein [Haloarchaeobius amylolyticus]